jgi:hypothetical protein
MLTLQTTQHDLKCHANTYAMKKNWIDGRQVLCFVSCKDNKIPTVTLVRVPAL